MAAKTANFSEFMARLFIVAHAVQLREGHLQHEQASIFPRDKTVMTSKLTLVREWDSIRQRIRAKGSRLRKSDASFFGVFAVGCHRGQLFSDT